MIQSAAAKSLQSCLTLCNPIDGSTPGSSVPGLLHAGILEWVAISFSMLHSSNLIQISAILLVLMCTCLCMCALNVHHLVHVSPSRARCLNTFNLTDALMFPCCNHTHFFPPHLCISLLATTMLLSCFSRVQLGATP